MSVICKLPQGKIIIGYSDKNLSIGLLYLESYKKLDKHNRPVEEELVQVSGTSVMKLFDGEGPIKEVVLRESDRLVIPAYQYHIHANPSSETSITMWRFDGDITQIIEDIRNKYRKIL